MEARLAEFASLLRSNGVRVAPGELADAVAAGALVDVGDRAAFRAALRSTLVKRSADVPTFDALFELYFSGLGRLVEGLDASLVRELTEQGLLEGDDLEMIARTLGELVPGLGPLARAALTGDAGLLARLLGGAALQLEWSGPPGPGSSGFHARRLLSAAGGAGLHDDLASVEAALRARGLEPGRLKHVAARLDAALRRVEDAARAWTDLAGEARTVRRREEGRQGGLARLAPGDLARAEVAVKRLAGRLKSRVARRDRSRRRGVLAVRRTLRRNLAWGGIPARLAFRRRRPLRPDVVVLCDVSESVRHATRLMLLFLYELQALFARVRTFVYVSDLAEVTAALKGERDPSRAADLAVAARAVSLSQNSNCGRALALFHARFRGAVTRRTTVLVIGDGRNNYHPPELWALDELRRRARRVLWISPEPRETWGTGDSDLPLYAARSERVAQVTSLAELEGLADALFPRA